MNSQELRTELSRLASAHVKRNALENQHYSSSKGVVLFKPYVLDGVERHGNFLQKSYSAILARPDWRCRLCKSHTHAGKDGLVSAAKETDSCNSSDALLMNIFCHPDVQGNTTLANFLGVDSLGVHVFGWKTKLPWTKDQCEHTPTEIDMFAQLLVEAKLTEQRFQVAKTEKVERYRDFSKTFDPEKLQSANGTYEGYQVIRNVLAALHHNARLCLIYDQRRDDLLRRWNKVQNAIKDEQAALKERCRIVSWQQIAANVPNELQQFLEEKYGIKPPAWEPITPSNPCTRA